MPDQHDERLRSVFLTPLRSCANYRPKFGGSTSGVSLSGFQVLYGADPLYRWIGLDSEEMYAAHRAAGGITSVYRQLGIACERLFREVVRLQLGLDEEQVKWGYTVERSNGTTQRLTLDARITTDEIADDTRRAAVEDWLALASRELSLDIDLSGAVFEVRQGYKSADSKRQNADLQSAMQAITSGMLPVVTVFSNQINETVARRYRNAKLLVMTGTLDGGPTASTFAFARDVLGFDLPAFFERNTETFKEEITGIVGRLISPEE